MWYLATVFLFTPIFLLYHATLVYGQSNRDGDYTLEIQDINPDIPTPKPMYLQFTTPTPTHIPSPIRITKGYNALEIPKALTLTIEPSFLDFGQLNATSVVKRVLNISVASPTTGYTLQLWEDHPLMETTTKGTIPDTTCDTGTCTETRAAPWMSTLTYGLGYRCDSPDRLCDRQFTEMSMFKHFANKSANQLPTQLVRSDGRMSTKAQITVGLNVSGTQAKGYYSNTLYLLATPFF